MLRLDIVEVILIGLMIGVALRLSYINGRDAGIEIGEKLFKEICCGCQGSRIVAK